MSWKDFFYMGLNTLVFVLFCLFSFMVYSTRQDYHNINQQLEKAQITIDILSSLLEEEKRNVNENKKKISALIEKLALVEESIDPKNFRWAKIKQVREAVQKTSTEGAFENIIAMTTYSSAVVDYSEKYDVSIPLILAVTRRESAFNAKAVSLAGAKGLMQIIPTTAQEISADIGKRYYSLFKIRDNVHFGTWYLWKMMDQFDDNVGLAVRAYNCGPTCVRKVLAKEWKNYPEETRIYVEIVLKWKKGYEDFGL